MSKVKMLKSLAKWGAIPGIAIAGQVTGKGGIGVVMDVADFALLPKEEKPGESVAHKAGRSIVDGLFGNGTLRTIDDSVDEAIDKAKQTAGDVQQATGEIRQSVSGSISGVSNAGNSIGDIFGGLMNNVKGIFGGGGTGLNIGSALMLPLAWFLFGKFGWMGKIGAGAMMMYALSNLLSNREPSLQAAPVMRESLDAGGGRKILSAGENFENLHKQMSSDGQDYNVRAVR